jgi:hypothetical protein
MMESKEELDDDMFMRRMTWSEEERRQRCPWTLWNGGYRWFESPNVVDLWPHYSEVQRFENYKRLRRLRLMWPMATT